MEKAKRKPRIDALTNRQELLKAAAAVIREHGSDITMDDIARLAKVGRATLYRNFPDRLSLFLGVVGQNMLTIEEEASRLDHQDDAFFRLLRFYYDFSSDNRSLSYFLTSPRFPHEDKQQVSEKFQAMFQTSFQAAQAAGKLKEDLDLKRVSILGNMLTGALGGLQADDKDSREWAFDLVCRAIRRA